MGENIGSTEFTPADFERFRRRLDTETAELRAAFSAGGLSEAGYTWGFELEAWLLDHNYFPTPINESLLAALDDAEVVPELSRFNVELNTPARRFTPATLAEAQTALSELWQRCNAAAHELDANMVAIGTLPTIRDADLSLRNISPLKRFYALNHEILRQRGGQPIHVRIEGEEALAVQHSDVMLEAAATSLQIHLKTPASLAHRYLNASMALSAPVLAASANAPILFDRLLWAESRVPLFEQSIACLGGRAGQGRVSFGSGYVRESIIECFEENRRDYPPLLPMSFHEPADHMHHLRLHNGTIWRWNRPLIGWEADGRAHVRLEFRPLPGGPSIADMIANCALYLGLVHEWVMADRPLPLAFDTARGRFYEAARTSLAAEAPGGRSMAEWLLSTLLPAAETGLARLGIDAEDRDHYLTLIERRIASGQTGASWQRRAYINAGRHAHRLMAAYCENQRSGKPVHEWELPA